MRQIYKNKRKVNFKKRPKSLLIPNENLQADLLKEYESNSLMDKENDLISIEDINEIDEAKLWIDNLNRLKEKGEDCY